MPTTIEQYREAKATYHKLQNQAKKELLSRFQDLANELLQIQKELREDFGTKVSIPTKPKAARRNGKDSAEGVSGSPELAKATPAIVRIEKRLARQREKLEQSLKTGNDSKAIKDRIYEIEDELRLAKEK